MKDRKTTTQKVCYIGAALSIGQHIPGAEKTPQIFRDAGLFKALEKKYSVEVVDLGDIALTKEEEQLPAIEHQVQNLAQLGSTLGRFNETVLQALQQHPDSMVVTVGGDHSVGSATLHALHTHYKDLKVIWVDAHPDFIDNSLSDYYGYHGYPVSHVTGLSKFPGFPWLTNLVPFENIVFIAIRDIDPDEWINLKKYNIKCFTMDHVTDLGIGQVVNQAINYLDPIGNANFHISFDIDAAEPFLAPGTGTKFRGGLSEKESHLIVRKVAHLRKLVGLDVVEINAEIQQDEPRIPYRGQHYLGPVTATVGFGIDLIESAFTKYMTL